MENKKVARALPSYGYIAYFIAIFSGWLVFQLDGVGIRDGLILSIYGLFVFIALAHYLRSSFSIMPRAPTGKDKLYVILSALPLVLLTRLSHIDFISRDYVTFLSVWCSYIQKNGLAAYTSNFADYTPFYTYMLGIPALFLPAANWLVTIKIISFAGEALAALFIYLIIGLKYGQKSLLPLLAVLLFLLLPTVVINSALIAQCDVWYTAFLLGCVFYAIRGRPALSMAFFAFALALKLQSIFLSPFMLVLVLNRKMPWCYFALIPVIYSLTCLPAWLEGRSWLDLATIYIHQAGEGKKIARHVPTLYAAISKHFKFIGVVKWAGIIMTCALMAMFSILNRKTLKERSQTENYVFLSFASVALSVFFLPEMHDRYFFPADVFSLVVAILMPRFWFLPICYQLISGLGVLQFNDPDYFLSQHHFTFIGGIVLSTAVSLWLYQTSLRRTFLLENSALLRD